MVQKGREIICTIITKIFFASPYSVVSASFFGSWSDDGLEFRWPSGYEPGFCSSSGYELEICSLDLGTASQILCRNCSAALDRLCKSNNIRAP
jgi:hypothetical protein